MEIFVSELPKSCEECKLGYFCDCQYCFLRPDLAEKDEWCEKEKHCKLLPLSDRLTEERKRVVQEIKKEFEPSPNTTIIEGTPTPEAELVNRGFSVCKQRVYKVLDRIERGE